MPENVRDDTIGVNFTLIFGPTNSQKQVKA